MRRQAISLCCLPLWRKVQRILVAASRGQILRIVHALLATFSHRAWLYVDNLLAEKGLEAPFENSFQKSSSKPLFRSLPSQVPLEVPSEVPLEAPFKGLEDPFKPPSRIQGPPSQASLEASSQAPLEALLKINIQSLQAPLQALEALEAPLQSTLRRSLEERSRGALEGT